MKASLPVSNGSVTKYTLLLAGEIIRRWRKSLRKGKTDTIFRSVVKKNQYFYIFLRRVSYSISRRHRKLRIAMIGVKILCMSHFPDRASIPTIHSRLLGVRYNLLIGLMTPCVSDIRNPVLHLVTLNQHWIKSRF